MDIALWIDSSATKADLLIHARDGKEFRIVFANDLGRALEILRGSRILAVLAHLPVAGCMGDELLRGIQQAGQRVPIVVYEPGGMVSRGAELAILGAFQYISQQATPEELYEVLAFAIRHWSTGAQAAAQDPADWAKLLVGSSSAMREVIEVIRLVANRRSTVLITGETGTGKEIAARAIHIASGRAPAKMVAINCAALPDHLLEAELFGHTKGAFTGAVNARVGLFEQAHRGTILLDEIGEMPLPLQTKLLRVLQEREIQRVGSSETIPVDVRVIAATNQNLAEAVATRRFREDLYYRLNVVALRMPPLREKASDIPDLVEYFLEKIAGDEWAHPKRIEPAALDLLTRYHWPGNVRQLEHAIESAVALSGPRMTLHASDFDLPAELAFGEVGALSLLDVPESGINFDELIMGIERRLLERALLKAGGNKARAANMLQMKRTTLISKFKALEVCA